MLMSSELAPEMSFLETLSHLPFKVVMDVTEALFLSHRSYNPTSVPLPLQKSWCLGRVTSPQFVLSVNLLVDLLTVATTFQRHLDTLFCSVTDKVNDLHSEPCRNMRQICFTFDLGFFDDLFGIFTSDKKVFKNLLFNHTR